MLDPRYPAVQAVLHSMGQPVGSRRSLHRLLDQFVFMLIPKQELAALIAEAILREPQFSHPGSPAAPRMAAAIALSSIGSADAAPDETDVPEWQPPRLPLIRTRWLRRMTTGLLRVRIALEKSFAVKHSPLLDQVDEQLTLYLWTIMSAHRLAWAKDDEMPDGLAGALTEQIIEASVGLPALAEEVVLASLVASDTGGGEQRRLTSRVQRSVVAGLENEPAPNDLRHFRQQARAASLLSLLGVDESSFVPPDKLVGSDEPPRFFQANLEDPWFVAAARQTPARLERRISAA